jgi:hypothetical protein
MKILKVWVMVGRQGALPPDTRELQLSPTQPCEIMPQVRKMGLPLITAEKKLQISP